LGPESLMRGGRVWTDAEDDSVALLDLGIGVAEAAGLHSAARSVVHGIEVDDNTSATQIRESDEVALIIGQGKVWRQISDRQLTGVLHCWLVSFCSGFAGSVPQTHIYRPLGKAASGVEPWSRTCVCSQQQRKEREGTVAAGTEHGALCR